MRLAGKIAIVTGAGRGIGRGTAIRFAAEGAKVVVDDINETTGTRVVEEICANGGEASFFAGDVGDEDSIKAMVAFAETSYGGLDILVNNAICATEHITENHWQPTVDILLRGAYLGSLAAIDAMKRRGGGSIVNLSSVNATFGLQAIHVYSAAKGGILSLTRSLAIENGKHKIRVNAICPGTIQTEVWEPILEKNPEIWNEIARFYPLGRLGTVEDIANCALFLASDESSFATGAVFTIDGGLTAGNHEFPI